MWVMVSKTIVGNTESGLDTKLSKKERHFRVHYSDDIFAAGRINKTFWDSSMKFNELNMDIYNDHFTEISNLELRFCMM